MTTAVRSHRTLVRLGAARLAAAALAVALLAGCGGDGDSTAADPAAADPSATTSATDSASAEATESATGSEEPKKPQCADVWVAGGKLPGGYQDCYDGERRIKANGRYCEFGRPLVTYESRFWAVPGGIIHEVDGKLLDDAKYRDSLRKCSG